MLTPERKEEIKRSVEQVKNDMHPHMGKGYYSIALDELEGLLAALKEAEQQLQETEDWETDAYAWRDFCNERNNLDATEFTEDNFTLLRRELAEAQQTIARQQLYIEKLELSRESAQKAADDISKEKGLELFEARQTIARLTEELEAEQRKSIIDHCCDLNRYDDDDFSAPVCIDELPEEDKAEVMDWLFRILGSCAESAVDMVVEALGEGAKEL